MIAAIRVRFTATDPAKVWNDAVFTNWLDANHPYSLAEFWRKSSFGHAELSFNIFPPIVMDDPRDALTPTQQNDNNTSRKALIDSVTAKVTEQFHPDWGYSRRPIDLVRAADRLVWGRIVWRADSAFSRRAPMRYIPAAVSDIHSSYDSVCQELGHAYGFESRRLRSRNSRAFRNFATTSQQISLIS